MNREGHKMVMYAGVRVGIVTANRWRAIEEEYGESIRNVLTGYRHDGNSWDTIAGSLGVCWHTLRSWCQRLSIPIDRRCQWGPGPRYRLKPSDAVAQAHGYTDLADAIRDLRVKQRKTMREAAATLGVHLWTIDRNTPPELRGIMNRSVAWYPSRRATMLRNRRNPSRDHLWRKDEDIRIATCCARLSGAGKTSGR